MVRAEISYNPYLLETKVIFNNQPPKMNSRVNKFTRAKLQSWLNELPGIFRDEMNGYNFELLFSGTVADFEELKDSFRSQKVNVDSEDGNQFSRKIEDAVQIVLKNELEGSEAKALEVEKLNEWLESNHNRRFNAEIFMRRNAELFSDPFVVLLVGNGVSEKDSIDGFEVSVQNVKNLSELPSDISDTPIIVMVDADMFNEFDQFLNRILNVPTITKEQLFFIVSDDVDSLRVKNEIIDSGIDTPNIITSYDDAKLVKYFSTFSLVTYIAESISEYELSLARVEEGLVRDTKQQELQNKPVFERIDQIESDIINAEFAKESIEQRDNWQSPNEFKLALYDFLDRVMAWKKRTVKLTSEQAEEGAAEFREALIGFFDLFKARIEAAVDLESKTINSKLTSLFEDAELVGIQPKPVQVGDFDFDTIEIPDFTNYLLNLKRVDWVRDHNDIFQFVKDVMGSSDAEMVRKESYPLQEWREYAVTNTAPLWMQ
ncbi:hypothetical protein P3T51_08915 [Weissella confusa]|uniref:hypothetical protein n=1 Tax=Weissella confusa TaxID=1583 RepID=UPI0024079579|nr:hypothetical protein [Weissella confusa]WEY47676.1 hypothetical protein P3T51_08915 [Weissella confusa]